MKTFFDIPESCKSVELFVSLKSGDVSISPSENEKIEVDMPDLRKGTFEEIFDMSMEDNKLIIKEKKNKFAGMNFMNFGGDQASSDLVLLLPAGINYIAELQLYNGSLKVKDLNLTSVINTYNGDISVQNVEGGQLKVNSYNGDLSLKNFSGALTVEQFNGDVSCQGCVLTGIHIKSFSGDIDLKGKINLQQDSSITTMSGDVSIFAEEYLTDKTIMISTMSGDQDIKGNIPDDRIIVKNKMKQHGIEFMKGFKPMMKGIFDSIGTTMAGQKDKVHTEVTKAYNNQEENERKDANIEKILTMLSEGKISFEESERLIKLLKV